MSEWHETSFERLEDGSINCHKCKWHAWEIYSHGDIDYCDKKNELFPKDCDDFETYKFKYAWEVD